MEKVGGVFRFKVLKTGQVEIVMSFPTLISTKNICPIDSQP